MENKYLQFYKNNNNENESFVLLSSEKWNSHLMVFF